jgi:hypothetical protein
VLLEGIASIGRWLKRISIGASPEDSLDGPVFADKVHFVHPSIQQHHETVNPAVHETFTSAELQKMWKGI